MLQRVLKKKNKNDKELRETINKQDHKHRTPLMIATINQAYDSMDVVSYLFPVLQNSCKFTSTVYI